MNEAAEAYLDYYLGSPDTPFAVLLEGRWGSGKTYFLRRYMDERAAKVDAALKPRQHLYASLNGLSSTSEIITQFFAQSAPILSGKTASMFSLAIARAANVVTGGAAFDTAGDGAKLKEFMLNLDGKVLVFDDLERCQMPLGEVLGFINNYVEHDGHKVILLAAENEIPKKIRSDYLQRKEKLIGKTLRVGSDAGAVYDLLVDGMRTPEAKALAKASRAEAVSTFTASGIENFRSLRAVLDDFDRLVGAVDAKLRAKHEAMTRLLVMMIALGMEHRSGALETNEVAQFQRGLRSSLFAFSKREISEEERKLTAISQKYPDVSWGDPVVPLESLAALFSSGEIDTSEIDPHLLNHPLIADPTQLPAWRRLWSWSDLNQTDYAVARRAFIEDLDKRAYTNPAVILHAAGVVRALATANDRLFGRRDITKYFKTYIDDLVTKGTLETDGDLFDRAPTGAFGLGFKTDEEPGFDAIKVAVRAGGDKAVAAQMKTQAPALLVRLAKGRDEYDALYEYGYGPDNFGAVAILACASVDDFAKLLIIDGKPTDRLFGALAERYERAPGLALAVEEAWLKSLKGKLTKTAAKATQPHRYLLEARIAYFFDKIDAAFASMKARAGV